MNSILSLLTDDQFSSGGPAAVKLHLASDLPAATTTKPDEGRTTLSDDEE